MSDFLTTLPVEAAARLLLGSLVPDDQMADPGLAKTPARLVRALREMTSGYDVDLGEILATTFESGGYDQIVAVRDVPFASLCEHHVLPFTGRVSVAYLPRMRVVGLSKIPRLVRALSRRLQIQERLTREIAGALEAHLLPLGVVVVVRGVHTCMTIRGAEAAGEMVTSDVRGLFREDAAARAEAFALLGEGGR